MQEQPKQRKQYREENAPTKSQDLLLKYDN